jgi:hypothetical protein
MSRIRVPPDLADAELVALVLPFDEPVSSFHEDSPRRYRWGDIPLPRRELPLREAHDGRQIGLLSSFVLARTGLWAKVKAGRTAAALIADGFTGVSAEIDDGKLTGAALVTDGRPAFPSARIFIQESGRVTFSDTATALAPATVAAASAPMRSVMDLSAHRRDLAGFSMTAVDAEVADRRRRFEERQLELQQADAAEQEGRLLASGVPTSLWPEHLPGRQRWEALQAQQQAKGVVDAGDVHRREFEGRMEQLEIRAERSRRRWWKRWL